VRRRARRKNLPTFIDDERTGSAGANIDPKKLDTASEAPNTRQRERKLNRAVLDCQTHPPPLGSARNVPGNP